MSDHEKGQEAGGGRPPATRTTGTVRTGAVVALIAVAVTAGCGVGLLLGRSGGRVTSAATTAASTGPASPSPSAPVPSTTATTTTSASASASSSSGLVPLRLTDAVRAALVRAYDTAHGYPPGWVTGTEPGSVFIVVDPSTGDHLAWAGFTAATSAPEQVHVVLQDGGSRTALRQPPGGSWTVYDICTTPEFLALVGPLPAGGHC